MAPTFSFCNQTINLEKEFYITDMETKRDVLLREAYNLIIRTIKKVN